jgi:sulfate transport system ATP-binding protein
MSFIGPVNQLGDSFIRPHDLDILLEPRGGNSQEAMVERVVHLGFEVRVELTLQNGEHIWAQVTRSQAEELELEGAGIVYVRPARKRTFHNGRPRTEELQAI